MRDHPGLAAAMALVMAALALAQEPVGQHGDRWHLGILQSGQVYRTTITVGNENCDGKHDFEVTPDAEVRKVLVLPPNPIVRGIAPGSSKELPAAIDLRQTPAGGYERGTVFIRCLTCPAECKQTIQQLKLSFAIVDLPPDGPPARPPGGGPQRAQPENPPSVSKPPEDEGPPRCGPDVTEAFTSMLVDLLGRIDFLPASERGPEGGKAFLLRNGIRPFSVSAIGSCPRQPECFGTVQLFDRCLEVDSIGDIVEGLLQGRLEVPGRNLDDSLGADREPDSVTARRDGAFAIGVGLANSLGAPLDVRDAGTAGEIRREIEFWLSSGVLIARYPKAAELWNRFAQCGPCGEKAGFQEDWSIKTWYLAGGKTADP